MQMSRAGMGNGGGEGTGAEEGSISVAARREEKRIATKERDKAAI
jgi:hypothetical protein